MAQPTNQRIDNFEDFWLFYLREHSKPRTRTLHYIGTSTAALGIAACVILGKLWFLLAVPVFGYGPSWVAHFFVEKNRPATFRYPLWSLVCDFRMAFSRLTGEIDDELARAGVSTSTADRQR